MIIKLQSLTMRNFRGIRNLSMTLNGGDAHVSGDNGAGKSTIFDAFLWLLLAKDSENRSQLEIKTLDENSKPIPNLELMVEAVITADDRRVTLKKLYLEDWGRTRGEANRKLKGYITEYRINGESVEKGEYTDYINNFINIKLFELITNPLYFNTSFHWTERRKMLFELCGDIALNDITQAAGLDPNAKARADEMLSGRTIDDAYKSLTAKRKELDKAIDEIPGQIKALRSTLPETEVNYNDAEKALIACREEIAGIDEELQSVNRALEPYVKKGKMLAKLKSDRDVFAATLVRESQAAYIEAARERTRLETRLSEVEADIKYLTDKVVSLSEQSREEERRLIELRVESGRVFESVYEPPEQDEYVCRACGQDLPAEKKEQLLSDAETMFNERRAKELGAIKSTGLRIKNNQQNTAASLESSKTKLSKLTKTREELTAELVDARAREQNTQDAEPDFESSAEYRTLCVQIDALQSELETSPPCADDSISERRAAIEARIQSCMNILSTRDNAERTNGIIAEYEQTERALSDETTEICGKLHCLDTLLLTRAKLIETKINNKFNTISFRLFKDLKNGEESETCEAVIGGIPYSRANTAAKVNAGLEVIDALCKHYNIYAPVFVDQCESINHLTPIASQVIKLEVAHSDNAKTLPGIITAQAARGDVYIRVENKESEEAS